MEVLFLSSLQMGWQQASKGQKYFFSKDVHINFSQKVFLACQLESSSNMVELRKNKKINILEVNVSSAAVESLFRLVV